MQTYQFTCAAYITDTKTEWDGYLVMDSAPGLITPPVTCNTPTEAIKHPDTVKYCEDNKCTVYRIVGK
jgi:hypothetical protein